MHIPENYISPSSCAVTTAIMIPIWTVAIRRLKRELSPEQLPLLGISAAFSFLIMMFNLPLPGGTSGHAVGSVLVAILLGPWSALITVSMALFIQALFFGDGGILAFATNAFNLAFVMPFLGYYLHRAFRQWAVFENRDYLAVFLSGYFAINIAALLVGFQLGIQPILFTNAAMEPLYCPYGLGVAIPAMSIPHLLFGGLIEGGITAAVFTFIQKVSPDLIHRPNHRGVAKRYVFALVGVVLLIPLGLLTDATAWGEWGVNELKEQLGFVPQAIADGFSIDSLFPDYTIVGVNDNLAYIISAILGTALLILSFKLFFRR